jgi:hypothetical protein
VRQVTTILFLLFFSQVFGQKWHLDDIDKSKEFKYKYTFTFENAEDSSSFIFKKKDTKSISTIQITDNKGDTVVYATIKVNDLENDTSLIILTSTEGLVKLELKPSKYNLEITSIGYDKFIFNFDIFENESFNLKVQLGLGPELGIYAIHSKAILSEPEILAIVNCVKENREVKYTKCNDIKRYFIMTQY